MIGKNKIANKKASMTEAFLLAERVGFEISPFLSISMSYDFTLA